MILFCKDGTIWNTNCSLVKSNEVSNNFISDFLDTNFRLEDGVKLWHIVKFVIKFGLDNQFVGFKKLRLFNNNNIDESYEYLSVIPKYNLYVKNNGVFQMSRSDIYFKIECDDQQSLFIFDFMVSDQLMNLEIRIENDVVEYNDATFFMPSEITLREFLYAISDGIIDS